MSDSDDLNLDDDAPVESSPKKTSGIAALLPNLLKFVAIGLGALIFIVTVSVITYSILNRGGRAQTVIPSTSPFVGTRPTFSFYTLLGTVTTTTRDVIPHSVRVEMILGYDENDSAAATELTNRRYELEDFVRVFFRSKTAEELGPENEPRLRQEIIEQLNTRMLNTARVRIVLFRQLDVMRLQ